MVGELTNTFKVKSILHSELTNSLLDQIALLKDIVWPTGLEEQKKYIVRMTNPSDYHCYIESDGFLIGYVCIKSVKIRENEIEIPALGVAGLCTLPSVQGSGVGKSILTYFMNQCKLNKVIGILFCKEKVKKFYQKNGWTTYPIKVNGDLFNHYFMVYNYLGNTQSTFQFQGELF